MLLGIFGWGVPPEFPYPGPISDRYMPGLSDLEQGVEGGGMHPIIYPQG